MSPESPLTKKQQEAALLVAEDNLSDDKIAARLQINRRTLTRWRSDPAFSQCVTEHQDRWRRELAARGLADRQNRVDALNDRWDRMKRVIEARAHELADVPGGDTGLLVRKVELVKVYKTGDEGDSGDLYSAKKYVEVETYSVDVALLKELRATEEQAAKDLGQWTEKKEVTGKDGAPIAVTVYLPDNGRDSVSDN